VVASGALDPVLPFIGLAGFEGALPMVLDLGQIVRMDGFLPAVA
jgi:hypothetical protein